MRHQLATWHTALSSVRDRNESCARFWLAHVRLTASDRDSLCVSPRSSGYIITVSAKVHTHALVHATWPPWHHQQQISGLHQLRHACMQAHAAPQPQRTLITSNGLVKSVAAMAEAEAIQNPSIPAKKRVKGQRLHLAR